MIKKFSVEILLPESNWFKLAFESVNSNFESVTSDPLCKTTEKMP